MSNSNRRDPILAILNYLGQTVTVYTTSGGESGQGFTGVLVAVNPGFIRLLSDIGPAPACALGSCCKNKKHKCHSYDSDEDSVSNNELSRINCNIRNTGAVVDIPTNRIAAFVHNAI